jgi:hypothetical protein
MRPYRRRTTIRRQSGGGPLHLLRSSAIRWSASNPACVVDLAALCLVFSDRDYEGSRTARGLAEPETAPGSGPGGDCRASRGSRRWDLGAVHLVQDLINFLLMAAGVAAFVLAQAEAQYRTSKQAGPRPRSQYLLFCLGYLAAAAVSAAAAGWADANQLRWLSAAMTGPAALSFLGALVTFGRGAFRGRARRAFWRSPPLWLDQEMQQPAT